MDLQIASLGINTKVEADPEFESKFISTVEKFSFPAEDKMKKVAEHIGITLEVLVASPNMDKLIEQFDDHVIRELIDALQSLGFTHKEAFAFIVLGLYSNLLD